MNDVDDVIIERIRDAAIRIANAEAEVAKAKALSDACRDELKDAQKQMRLAVNALAKEYPLFEKVDQGQEVA